MCECLSNDSPFVCIFVYASSEDIDVDECDARRDECVTVMSDIERQFSGLKEQLYREKLEQIELKLGQVRGGKSSEYVGPLQKLEENMQIRRQVAGVLKGFRTTGESQD